MSAETTWDTAIEASAAQPADNGGTDAGAEALSTDTTEESAAEVQTENPSEAVAAPSGDAEVAGEEKTEAEQGAEEDDEETNDPPELQALPSKSAARRQARRERVQRLEAESAVVQNFLDPTAPIGSVAETLEQRSPSRYHELVEDFFENHGEQYLQKRYGLKAEELDAIVQGRDVQPAERQASDPDYDPLNDPLIPDELKTELRELRGMKDEFGQVKETVKGFETKEQERERLAQEAETSAIKNEVFQSVFPVVVEAVKEYGLEPSKDDPPRIAALKKIGARLLVEDVDPVFMKDAENKKAVDRVNHWASKREKENALREADALKVRSRAAAEAVRQGEEVDTILWVIEELTKSKAKQITERGKGQPPVPAGAPPGGAAIPKTPITSWDDALQSVGS